ncbi:hypothetical protein [Zavarzinella formosa]|uniref:hypothetical protein n=1 Tax=Zavarzinella formosa TaxID=360055 RepID=UPI00030D2FC9|nr:hypothetical protein [Zavarzinella formosa]
MLTMLTGIRRLISRQAYLTTFETVVVCGVLVCLCLAALTATIQRNPQGNMRPIATIPSSSH